MNKRLLSIAFFLIVLTAVSAAAVYADAGLSVKVNPPQVSLKSARETQPTLTANASKGTAPYTFKWEKSSDPAGARTEISGAAAAEYKPPVAAGSAFYFVTVTDSKGATATSDAVHVRTDATAPAKNELKTGKSWNSITVSFSSALNIGTSWRAVVTKEASAPAKITDEKGSSAITKVDKKFTGKIKISDLDPETTYYVYACTYVSGYSMNGKSKELIVSDWSEPVQVKTPKISAPKSLKAAAGKKKMTVTWKALTDKRIAGYQISYKLKGKKAKNAKVNKPSAQKKVIKKLKKGKCYYVKIRAYAKIADKTVYGNWSKTVKTKKIK